MTNNFLLIAWIRSRRAKSTLALVFFLFFAMTMLNVGSMMGEHSAEQKKIESLGAASYRLNIGGTGELEVPLGTKTPDLQQLVSGIDPTATVELTIARIVATADPQKIISFAENDWQAMLAAERFELVSGRLPEQPGEVMIDQRLQPLVDAGVFKAYGELAQWKVTGMFKDHYPEGKEQFEWILAAPGTWAALPRDEGEGFVHTAAIPVVTGKDPRANNAEDFRALVELYSDAIAQDKNLNAPRLNADYLFDTSESAYSFFEEDRTGALAHRPVFLQYPIWLFSMLLGLLVGVVAWQFMQPAFRLLRGSGLAERRLWYLAVPVGLGPTLLLSIAGSVLGLLTPLILAPLLSHFLTQPLGPWGIDFRLWLSSFLLLSLGVVLGFISQAIVTTNLWGHSVFRKARLAIALGVIVVLFVVALSVPSSGWIVISAIMLLVIVISSGVLAGLSVVPLGRRGSLSVLDVSSRIFAQRWSSALLMTCVIGIFGALPVSLSNTQATFMSKENEIIAASLPKDSIRLSNVPVEQVSRFGTALGLDSPFLFGLIKDAQGNHIGFDQNLYAGAIFQVSTVQDLEDACGYQASLQERQVLERGGVLTADKAKADTADLYSFPRSTTAGPTLIAELPVLQHGVFGNWCDQALPNVVLQTTSVAQGWVMKNPTALFLSTTQQQQADALNAPVTLSMDPENISVYRDQGKVRPSWIDFLGGLAYLILATLIAIGGSRVFMHQIQSVRNGLELIGVQPRWLQRLELLVLLRIVGVATIASLIAGTVAEIIALRIVQPDLAIIFSPWPYAVVLLASVLAVVIALRGARRAPMLVE